MRLLGLLALGCSTAVGASENTQAHADVAGEAPRVAVDSGTDAGAVERSAVGFVSLDGRGCEVVRTVVQCEKSWLVTLWCETGEQWVFDGSEWRLR